MHPRCDDGTMPADDPLLRFSKMLAEALEEMGGDLHKCANLRAPLTRMGFTNIQLVKKKVPIGTWDARHRVAGKFLQESMIDFIPAATGKLFEMLGIGENERALWAAHTRKAMLDKKVHRYYNFYFWTAQKPAS